MNDSKDDNKKLNKGKQKVKLTEKYFLTIREAVKVFGIGEQTLRRFVKENDEAEFIAYVGNRALIKRKKLEEYLDNHIIAF